MSLFTILWYIYTVRKTNGQDLSILAVAQCSKWYEISDMDIFQITEENPDPPTNQGAYFNISLTI